MKIRINEASVLACIVFGVLVLLALLSFSPADPGWTYIGQSTTGIQNFGGLAGSWLSDVLFSLFGYMAFCFPIILFAAAWMLYNRKQFPGTLTVSGWLLTITGGCVISSLHFSNAIPLPVATGGLLGDIASLSLLQILSVEFATTLAVLVFVAGLTLAVRFSWLYLCDLLGSFIWETAAKLLPMMTWHTVIGNGNKNLFKGLFFRQQAKPDWYNRQTAELEEEKSDAPEFTTNPRYQTISVHEFQKTYQEFFGEPAESLSDAPETDDNLDEQYIPVVAPQTGNQTTSLTNNENANEVVYTQTAQQYEEIDSDYNALSLADKVRYHQQNTATATEEMHYADNKEITSPPQETPFTDSSSEVGNQQEVKSDTQQLTADIPVIQHTGHKQREDIVYSLPTLNLVEKTPVDEKVQVPLAQMQQMGKILEQKLHDFNVTVKVVAISPGPVITRFEVQPAPGVKVIRIANLAKDLARSLAVISVRVVEVIPGKSTVGIEIPNKRRQSVRLGDVLDSSVFNQNITLPLALGHDIEGKAVVANLEKMPHLLVAGTTGSGKSVGINAMLISLLFKLNPHDVRFIMVDPKMLELSVYNGIPHLLTPVITDMKHAANGLRWCVAEMERRYRLMSKLGMRNLESYNRKIRNSAGVADPLASDAEHAPLLKTLPLIVIIIDEYADMMMMVGKKVEELIARIAQKARAAGIHLILATQRPSVDVITGLIKANIPSRIAFQVSSKIDSRTILDQTGADQLLGQGDMLYQPPGTSVPQRVHGAFVSDEEVHRVVNYWKQQDEPQYIDNITSSPEDLKQQNEQSDNDEQDELYNQAVEFIQDAQRVSISLVQRKLKIGYNRAARIIETMEENGIVSPMESNGKREVLLPAENK